jgi:hypothetical protein
MAQKPKNSSVITVRRRDSVALPPATLGFASLTEPDTYDPDKPMFKLDACYNPAGIDALRTLVQKECVEHNLDKLRAEMAENSALKTLVGKEPINVSDWLEGKLKAPKDNAKVPLPKMVIACRAVRKGRDGKEYTVAVGCWDAHNSPLDLKALKLGMGSIIQPIVNANLYVSKTVNGGRPSPKLDLVGVRVLKLVRFGGARPPQETDEDAIRDVLGEEFQLDEDLSAFAAGATPLPGADPASPVPPSDEDVARSAF